MSWGVDRAAGHGGTAERGHSPVEERVDLGLVVPLPPLGRREPLVGDLLGGDRIRRRRPAVTGTQCRDHAVEERVHLALVVACPEQGGLELRVQHVVCGEHGGIVAPPGGAARPAARERARLGVAAGTVLVGPPAAPARPLQEAQVAHDQQPRERPVTPEQWDARYAEADQVWSGAPNGSLVAEVDGTAAGRALDVGCGEGADAIWLAGRGWRVTATDISAVALERARRAAQAAGVEVDWRIADIADGAPEPGAFDLVTTHYPALRLTEDDAAIRGLLDAVAPGGMLLVVGHAPSPETADHWDPEGWVQPGDVAQRLDGGWTVEELSTRPRSGTPASSHHSHDVVLRARRGG
jgi:SAM-dependent methyltransferase